MQDPRMPSKLFELSGNALEISGLRVQFTRTFRVTDGLPLTAHHFGSPSVYNVDPSRQALPADVLARGGVLIPTYPWEALYIHLDSDAPVALQISYQGRCALTGNSLSRRLRHRHRNYVVVPFHRHITGAAAANHSTLQFSVGCVTNDLQFRASHEVTHRITGLQLQVWNLNDTARQRWSNGSGSTHHATSVDTPLAPPRPQSISSRDWSTAPLARVWIHLVDPVLWPAITGSLPPASPISSSDYFTHGLPWLPAFDEPISDLHHAFTLLHPSTVPGRPEDLDGTNGPSIFQRVDATRRAVPVYPGDWKWC